MARVRARKGTYSELRNVPASCLVKVPKGISDEQAAAVLLKGLTAQLLLRQTHRVQRGEFILVHAAAGGVGSILTEQAAALLVAYPSELMRTHRVSKRVNKPENDDPELLTLVEA